MTKAVTLLLHELDAGTVSRMARKKLTKPGEQVRQRGGQPRLDRPMERTIRARVSEEEYQQIQSHVEATGEDMSNAVRRGLHLLGILKG
jgi:hypothetical protein